MKSFGKRKHNLEYRKRKGAYGIIQNSDGKFLVVKDKDNNLYLVGGKIELGENPIQTICREALEETGYRVKVNDFIGIAEKHWVSAKYPKWSQHNIGVFYKCDLLKKVTLPVEKEPILWVSLSDLEKYLFHEHHLYMVKKSLVLDESEGTDI
ncbi:NUDIX domain-containing protein [Clostridium senegalense]